MTKIVNTRLKKRYRLTKEGSSKETWHVTLDISGTDLDFKPGDSLAIYPENDSLLVSHLLESLGTRFEEPIFHTRSSKTMPIGEFLTKHANLSRLTSSFLKLYNEDERIKHLLTPDNRPQLKEYLSTHDPLDFLKECGRGDLSLQEICDQFGPLLPRFYSVASSKEIQKDAVDLTVALFTWTHAGEKRYGVASHYLCHMAEVGKTEISTYVQPANHFWLPQDHDTHLIMIGPGTGIAPFRAFLQERLHKKATGKHWLFFGERNRKTDFFYDEFWNQIQKRTHLQLSTAFSRDQEEKYYVHHEMEKRANELYSWLEEGAHLYVCGDAQEMAKDVHNTLHSILKSEGNHTDESAKQYLKDLKKQGRYLRDVY